LKYVENLSLPLPSMVFTLYIQNLWNMINLNELVLAKSIFLWATTHESNAVLKDFSTLILNFYYSFFSTLKWGIQESILSTFYIQIFCTKFWRPKLQSCVLGLKFFGAKTLAQNAGVKCQWNWQQNGLELMCRNLLNLSYFINTTSENFTKRRSFEFHSHFLWLLASL